MGDIGLSIYSKFMCLKSNVEVQKYTATFRSFMTKTFYLSKAFTIECE